MRDRISLLLMIMIFGSCKSDATEKTPKDSKVPDNRTITSVVVNAGNGKGQINMEVAGVNHGPRTVAIPHQAYNGKNSIDVSNYYRDAGFGSVRLDEFAHIDFANLFPDFNADPFDPANYRFALADEYIRPIVDLGIDVVFRAGYGKAHKRHVVPLDYEKWAEVILQVIKHYNEGWADGHHWNIKYWEIWNEPSGHGWDGPKEDYFGLYKTTALKIKGYNPDLQVGGPSLGGPDAHFDREFAKGFIRYCHENSVPLDFFAYHVYFTDPKDLLEHAQHHRQYLTAQGYTETELFLTEWGWLSGRNYPPTMEEASSIEDASADAAALIVMQGQLDKAHFYVGGALAGWPWGLMDLVEDRAGQYDVRARRSYYAFKLFNELRETKNSVQSVASDGVYVLSGVNDTDDKMKVLLSTYATPVDAFSIRVTNLKWSGEATCSVYIVDKERNTLKEIEKSKVKVESGAVSLKTVDILGPSVCLVVIEKD